MWQVARNVVEQVLHQPRVICTWMVEKLPVETLAEMAKFAPDNPQHQAEVKRIIAGELRRIADELQPTQ